MTVAATAGRLLLVTATALCWGGFVVPVLLSLAFPSLLPPDSLPRELDFGVEGTVANAVSALALLVVAVLALANVIVGRRKSERWIVLAGWAILAVAATYLAWDELLTDLHGEAEGAVRKAVFNDSRDAASWAIHLSLLPVAIGLTVLGCSRAKRRTGAFAFPLCLGFAGWLLATVVDTSQLTLFSSRADKLEIVLDESLEFSGSLLIALSASLALRGNRPTEQWIDPFPWRRLRLMAAGSVVLVALLGVGTAAFVFRPPIVDSQSVDHFSKFRVDLRDQESAVQEFRMPAVPLGSIRLRLATDSPAGDSGPPGYV